MKELTVPMRELKCSFQGIINAKNCQNKGFHPSNEGASMFQWGDYSPLALPWRHPCMKCKEVDTHVLCGTIFSELARRVLCDLTTRLFSL